MKLPDRIIINEVSLRDGLQNEPRVVPTGDKVELAGALAGCGITRIELSSFVNPKLVPQMADAEDLWGRVKRREGVLYSALVLNERGLDRAIKAGVPFVGIYVSASEAHSRRNSNMSIAEAKTEAVKLLKKAKAAGLIVRAGVMNAFGCAYEGNVPVTRVLKLVRAFLKRGADEICLADSSGLANPLQMEDVLARVRGETGETELSLHLHNTRGMGPANVFAALRQGVAIFDTSLGGLGGCPFIPGARGNIATEDTVLMLQEMKLKTGVDLDRLSRAGLPFETLLGKTFQTVASNLKRPPC